MELKTKVKLGLGLIILGGATSFALFSGGGSFQGSSKELTTDPATLCEKAVVMCKQDNKKACEFFDKNKKACEVAMQKKKASALVQRPAAAPYTRPAASQAPAPAPVPVAAQPVIPEEQPAPVAPPVQPEPVAAEPVAQPAAQPQPVAAARPSAPGYGNITINLNVDNIAPIALPNGMNNGMNNSMNNGPSQVTVRAEDIILIISYRSEDYNPQEYTHGNTTNRLYLPYYWSPMPFSISVSNRPGTHYRVISASGGCTSAGTFELSVDENKTCTVTIDD